MSAQAGSVEGILQCLDKSVEDQERVTVGDLIDALGFRSYGPFLMIPAVIEISPLGAIPGLPTFLAVVITLFASQMLLGQNQLWVPKKIRKRGVSQERLHKALETMRPVAHWLDKWFRERLPKLSGSFATRVAAICAIILCLTVPPLELVPFASSIPMSAIAVLGLAITVDDGAMMLVGFVLTLAALTSGVYLVMQST
jgi:hypothetical protein